MPEVTENVEILENDELDLNDDMSIPELPGSTEDEDITSFYI